MIASKTKIFVLFFSLFLAVASKSAFAFDLALIDPAELVQDVGKWIILDARPESDKGLQHRDPDKAQRPFGRSKHCFQGQGVRLAH